MASDTVPAAAPGPGDTPEQAAPAPARGLLASLLEPVDPARPTFDLTPTTDTADPAAYGTLTPGTQVSSATHHGDGDDGSSAGGNGGSGRQTQSVLRAWLLAGATRWARGGGTTNQRLAMLKAKAQARQIKTTRTVTVNSSGGLSSKGAKGASGNGSSGSGMGQKQPASKNSSGGAAKSPKNSNGSGRGGSSGGSGSSGSGGRGSSGSSGTGGGRGSAGSGGSGGRGQSGKNNGTGGGNGGKGSRGGSGSTTGNGSTSGNGKTPKNSNGGRGTKRTDRQSETTTCGDSSGISLTKDPKPKKAKDTTRGGTGKDTTTEQPWRKDPDTTGTPKDGKDTKAGKVDTKAPKADDANGKKISLKKTPKTKTDDTPRTPPADGTGMPLDTQSARETGYRDGTRAGRIVSQVEAYKDGVKDGYTDTRDAAQTEKTRLDEAHKDRKQQRAEEPQPVTADPTTTQSSQAVSSADDHTQQSIPPKPSYPPGYHAMPWDTSPQPIQVTSVGRDTIQLGAGAARDSISRGEVRTLKQYERRLEPKADRMTRISDASKAFQAHAEEQAKEVTQLLELAKGAEGGDNLVAEIARLKEAVDAQIGRAGEIHKRAVRAADSTRALLVNVAIRYGDMYKAVVESPLTDPAKMSYYTESTHA